MSQGVAAGRRHPRRTWLAAASVLGLAWMLAARIAGPSDAFDQTQPRTMSYTTDIIVHGHWVLPIERGEVPATKPPLYNWLAVPAVAALGFSSELGHKLPSVLALLAAWLALAWLGERLGPPGLGWMAALAFVSSYTIFKLGYLARPDMLLTALLLAGWMAATAIVAADRPGPALAACRGVLWTSVALAMLAKGPVAVVVPLYALLAARIVGGGWSRARALGWWWGLPLAIAPFVVWLALVYREAPEHVVRQLWFEELYGRVTGLGEEGTGAGPIELLRRAGHMPAYFLIRFAPWSLLAIGAIVLLWRGERPPSGRRRWLVAAGLYAGVTIVLFSLSAGKRADYLAGALAPAALLAAWLVVRSGRLLPRAAAVAAAALALGGATVYNERQLGSPVPGLGPAIESFVAEAAAVLDREGARPAFWTAGTSHLQAALGASEVDGPPEVRRRLDRDPPPLWIVAGRRPDDPRRLEDWLAGLQRRRGTAYEVEAVVQSAEFPWTDMWPEQIALYRVAPSARQELRRNSTPDPGDSDNTR